jgi:bacterioferritin-associated ferredoxin
MEFVYVCMCKEIYKRKLTDMIMETDKFQDL